MLKTHEKHPKLKLSASLLAIAVIAGLVLLADQAKSQQPAALATSQSVSQPSPSQTVSSTPARSPSIPSTPRSGFKNGTFSATSTYYVPHGEEEIRVSLTLKNGVIAGSSVRNSENNFTSASYQEDFASEYKNYVIGQKINGFSLNIIAGASDTSQAFNDALNQISAKAHA